MMRTTNNGRRPIYFLYSSDNGSLVADHSLIAKSDGKAPSPPQIAAAKPTPAVAKVKAIKKDEVDRKTLRHIEAQLQHATKGFDAISVLFQYLVGDVSYNNDITW